MIGLVVVGFVAIGGPAQAAPGDVTILAGSGLVGNTNGTGVASSFKFPVGVAADSSANIYVADTGNDVIRKVTPGGVVTTFAGTGFVGVMDGNGTAASFDSPIGLATTSGGTLYVSDYGSNLIRKVTSAGMVTTFAGSGLAGSADGPGSLASFNHPYGLAVDSFGNVYVADSGNFLIRKITPGGLVSTLAGSGAAGYVDATGSAASFKLPTGLAVDSNGNVYVADLSNPAIRKITPGGIVTTIAGSAVGGVADGIGAAASFLNPQGLAFDTAGNLFVVDKGSYSIRKIAAGAIVTTVAGGAGGGTVNGNGTSAQFNAPIGIAADSSGNLYVSENNGNVIRKIETPNAVTASSTTTTTAATTTTTVAVTTTTTLAGTTTTTNPAGTTTTTSGACVAGATLCPSTTTIVPSTTTIVATTTTTRVVPPTSLVFPTIPNPSVPVPPTVLAFLPVPTVATTQPVPAPTLTVAALIEKSLIPQAPVPGPSVEGLTAEVTPAYTGSSNTSTVIIAIMFVAFGSLLLAGRSIRSTTSIGVNSRGLQNE